MFYLSLLLRILYCPTLFPPIYSIFISNSILFYPLPLYSILDQKVGDRDRNIEEEDDDDEDDEDYVDGEEEDDDDEDDGK